MNDSALPTAMVRLEPRGCRDWYKRSVVEYTVNVSTLRKSSCGMRPIPRELGLSLHPEIVKRNITIINRRTKKVFIIYYAVIKFLIYVRKITCVYNEFYTEHCT